MFAVISVGFLFFDAVFSRDWDGGTGEQEDVGENEVVVSESDRYDANMLDGLKDEDWMDGSSRFVPALSLSCSSTAASAAVLGRTRTIHTVPERQYTSIRAASPESSVTKKERQSDEDDDDDTCSLPNCSSIRLRREVKTPDSMERGERVEAMEGGDEPTLAAGGMES